MIKVHDVYGRELLLTKQQWRDSVLLGNLEKHRYDPDTLYNLLVGALEDGFAADVVGYAEQLHRIDPIPARGATVLGIVYMDAGRIDDARRLFEDHIARHGEDGTVLTNLAKAYSHGGDEGRAETTLWHALDLEPNQDNGLAWYVAIQKERGGDAAVLDACRRIAALPGSWRAQLWLARDVLGRGDLPAALALYDEALTRGGDPAPPDLLTQMSGDLGKNGHLDEIVRLVLPRFDPAVHGMQVGNNLLKATIDLGRLEEARSILDSLYDQRRPEWRPTLDFWDGEVARAETARRAEEPAGEVTVTAVAIEGPLWMRDGSPFSPLAPAKSDGAPRIALFGSTALKETISDTPNLQQTDGPGRLSRAVPLLLAEAIQLTSDAVGVALIPWAQGKGFVLFGRPYDDADLCGLAGGEENGADFVVGLTLDATRPVWSLKLRLLRRAGGVRLAERAVEVNPENPGPAVGRLADELGMLLVVHAGVHLASPPAWYRRPTGSALSDYLLRLEQQLCVVCEHQEFLEGSGLHGEREMLDGMLQLCLHLPDNPTVRMLFAQMLGKMKDVRPRIVPEFERKATRLQQAHPVDAEIHPLVEQALGEAFAP